MCIRFPFVSGDGPPPAPVVSICVRLFLTFYEICIVFSNLNVSTSLYSYYKWPNIAPYMSPCVVLDGIQKLALCIKSHRSLVLFFVLYLENEGAW